MKFNSHSNQVYLTLLTVLISFNVVHSKQLNSTVFVLETSDSNSDSYVGLTNSEISSTTSQPELKNRNLDESHTRIVTDDGEPRNLERHTTPGSSTHHNHINNNNNNNNNHHHHNPSAATSHHQSTSSNSNSNHQNFHEDNNNKHNNGSIRRLEDDSKLTPAHRVSTTNKNQGGSHQNGNHLQHKPKSATGSQGHSHEHNQELSTTPKTEERLLISITSNEDDSSDYNQPNKQVGSSDLGNFNNDDSPSSAGHQQSQNHHQKRKPTITISIQDANVSKQNGGKGNPALILTPNEHGQIVIATLGSGAGIIDTSSSSSSNKFTGTNSNNHNSNNNNNKPIIEPSVSMEPPYSSNNYQTTSSSTQRPSLINSNGGDPYGSRPRPPVTSEERPQRPIVDDSGPGGRPVAIGRPVNEPLGESSSSDDLPTRPSQPISSLPSSSMQQQEAARYPLNERNCGLVHETKIVGGEVANPDDFLWMAAIIKSRPKDGEPRPFCGGSLITRRHILTAAHCLENLAPRDVLVRLGSYDFDDSTASSLSADYAIDQFRVPAHYSKKTHEADIAIMRLKTPLSASDNYKTVCMPQARRSYVGALGTVTGYGSQSQTFRRATPKLRQVTVPVWENRKCSVVYKKNLTESFLCAGYEEGGKDACQGDSGGPLMTEGPSERMMVVGVVSFGIGCGAPGYPGVYTRTSTYLDWIEKNTRE